MNKINVSKFGVAFGVAWAVFVFLLGFAAWKLNAGGELVEIISSIYKGYGSTAGGAFIGALWAFVSGYVWGVIIAFVYNKLSK